MARVYAISDPSEIEDPEYLIGLHEAVAAALAYGISWIDPVEEQGKEVPMRLLDQARAAARHGVSLDTVLRRYVAGYTLLGDFIVQEAEGGGVPATELQRALRGEAALFDRLVALISREYALEAKGRPAGSEQRRAECVGRLLDGDLLDTSSLQSEFAYDFSAWHLGAIVVGLPEAEALRDLLSALDCRLLLVRGRDDAAWVWLGSRRRPDPAELQSLLAASQLAQSPVAVGEPGRALSGWRLTHRQAAAVLPVALRGSDAHVRYADGVLLASVLQDEVLKASLRELYLAPLAEDRDGGKVVQETLRAYFVAERNVSSTATSLGVDRKTVTSRLRTIEQRLGRPLAACGAELETALRLQEMGSLDTVPPASLI